MEIDRSKEPSRLNQLAILGAEVLDAGVLSSDVDAWRGLLSCSPALLNRLTHQAGLGGRPLLIILADLIAIYREALTRRGERVLKRRRRDRYLADCASWAATPDAVKQGSWRSKRMSKGQRYEIIRTCQRLGIDPPGPITRGDAAIWLENHGANLNYRGKENSDG